MAEAVAVNEDRVRLSVLPLFYDTGTIFVLRAEADGTSFFSAVHLEREELERYRDLLDRALAHEPDELPDGCTCVVDVYGERWRKPGCVPHAELEKLG